MRTSSQQRRRAVYRFTRLLLLDPTPTHISSAALHVSLNPRPNMKTNGPMGSTYDPSNQRNQCIRSNLVRPSTVNEYAPRTLAGWTHHGTTPRRGKQSKDKNRGTEGDDGAREARKETGPYTTAPAHSKCKSPQPIISVNLRHQLPHERVRRRHRERKRNRADKAAHVAPHPRPRVPPLLELL